ncbi:MAG: hypothetical protein M0001_12810 [Treponema sp.]|nr:hypothetical protein [Treponema sp.]
MARFRPDAILPEIASERVPCHFNTFSRNTATTPFPNATRAPDSFLATSSKKFQTEALQNVAFTHRLWTATTDRWGAEAYRYVVNGRTAIEWVMERYQVRVDKDSGIKNDPNDWCTEVGDPRYIVDLVKRVTRVSIETMKIVDALPKWEPEGQAAQPEANYDAMGNDRGQWVAEKG